MDACQGGWYIFKPSQLHMQRWTAASV